MLRILGHLGLWAGLYAAASLVCFAQLSGLWHANAHMLAALVSVSLTAIAAYALDRVKLRDSWIDPADVAAQPARYAFLVPNARAVRAGAVAALVAGALVGLRISRFAPLAAILSATGVALYAPHPRRAAPRLKDLLWLKNAYVACGMAGFAALAAVAVASPRDSIVAWWETIAARPAAVGVALSLLLVRILLDAALCDIDDEPTDRLYGTSTFPTAIGPSRAWLMTGLARIGLAGAIFATPFSPLRARLAWGAVTLLGLALLRLRRPRRVRDPVDLRFPVEAALATLVLLLWPPS